MAQPQFIDSLLPGNPVFIAVTLNLNYLLFRYFQYAFHLDDYFRFGAKVRKILTLSYTCWAGRFRYKGQKLIDTVQQKLGAEFTVVLRPDESSKKFNVLPLRWIVERSFSWLESFRRIAMDYEFYSDTGEAMVQLAFCRLMYNKIYD